MRISEAFCKMRLSEYCTSQDVDRAIAVTVDSFVGAQKVSCKKALARAFAKYVLSLFDLRSHSLFPQLTCFPLFSYCLLVRGSYSVTNFPPLHRYTLAKPRSQRREDGRNGIRGGTRATAVMA